jgi:sulfur-oxidizing protein SoxB
MSSMNRREFLQILAAASAAGIALDSRPLLAAGSADAFYDFGNVHLLHFTDCHAQLVPIHFREPSVNLGVAQSLGKAPHLVGEQLLKAFRIAPKSREAHAFTFLDFESAARTYGKVGGFAHLSTLVKRLRGTRPGALLLDGGIPGRDRPRRLWTKGTGHGRCLQAARCRHDDRALGVHLRRNRVKEIVEKDLAGQTSNSWPRTSRPPTSRTRCSKPYSVARHEWRVGRRHRPGVSVHSDRQSALMVPEWTFGIQDDNMQKMVDDARAKGAQVVVVLSHNGMDVDLKMASRVRGIDAILGGHTHDGVPQPIVVKNGAGKTLVTNAGSNGKFLGVLDFDVKHGRISDFRYKLLPVFANLLPGDADDGRLDRSSVRAPHKAKLEEPLASERRTAVSPRQFQRQFRSADPRRDDGCQGAHIAFSPGFRWGTSILPGQTITREHLMDQTAITYPHTTVTDMTASRSRPCSKTSRQPLQSRSLLPARRRHGARRRPAIHLRSQCQGGNAHQRHAPWRATSRRGQDLQGRRLGARWRGCEGRADLGCRRPLPARQEDHRTAQTQPAETDRHEGESRRRVTPRYMPHGRDRLESPS